MLRTGKVTIEAVVLAALVVSDMAESFSGPVSNISPIWRRGKHSVLKQYTEDKASKPNVEDDFFTMYTNSNKCMVFDEKTGRFYETSGDDPLREGKQVVTSSARSLYVDELPIINYDRTKYSPNDMVPTEELFSRRPPSRTATERELSMLDMECVEEECNVVFANGCSEATSDPDVRQKYDIFRNAVRQCYDEWNRRNMEAVVNCFDEEFTYHDGQILESFTRKIELQRHFTQQAGVLPSHSRLVVDLMAIDTIKGQVTAEWHVEAPSSPSNSQATVVPLTRGVSFYTLSLNGDCAKISRGYTVSEMVIKPPKRLTDSLVESATRLFGNSAAMASGGSHSRNRTDEPPISIIREYFEAWNSRDMETALSCFVDECVYQTEDPVFVDTFRGKTALREHLEKNAAVLPSNCRIELDEVCVDSMNGIIGTTWHIKVGKQAIPNLRGCSMYTTDRATGLLSTGYDVTEAPVKIPRFALSLLSVPARLLLNMRR